MKNYNIEAKRIVEELEKGILKAEQKINGIGLYSEDGSDYGFSILPYNDNPDEGWYISNVGGDTESITDEQLQLFNFFVK